MNIISPHHLPSKGRPTWEPLESIHFYRMRALRDATGTCPDDNLPFRDLGLAMDWYGRRPDREIEVARAAVEGDWYRRMSLTYHRSAQ